MNKDANKIFKTLIIISPLTVKFCCMLESNYYGRKQSYHNLFKSGENVILYLDNNTFIQLEIKSEEWTTEKSISLTSKNIHQLLYGLRHMINLCKGNTDIYKYDETKNHINIYPKIIENNKFRITLVGDTVPRILMEPSVKNIDGIDKEAVRIYINRYDYYVDLTIDEMEGLYYTLNKVDFFIYGMNMIQYYVSSIDKIVVNSENTNNFKSRKKIFYTD